MAPVGVTSTGSTSTNEPTETPTTATPFGCDSIWNRWDCDTGGGGSSGPLTLFLGDWYSKVTAVDAVAGEVVWQTAQLHSTRDVYSMDINDSYVVASFSANRFNDDYKFAPIVILDIATGTETDRFSTALDSEQTFDSVEPYALVLDSDNSIYAAIRRRDGSGTVTYVLRKFDLAGVEQWTTVMDNIGYIPNALSYNGDGNLVYVDLDETTSKFYIVDKSDGSIIHQDPVSGTARLNQSNSVVPAPDGGFLVGFGVGTHIGRYDKDGGELWATEIYDPGTNAHQTVTISTDGTYVFAANDAYTYVAVLDYETGNLINVNIVEASIVGFEASKLAPDGSMFFMYDVDSSEPQAVDPVELVENTTKTLLWEMSLENDFAWDMANVLRYGHLPE